MTEIICRHAFLSILNNVQGMYGSTIYLLKKKEKLQFTFLLQECIFTKVQSPYLWYCKMYFRLLLSCTIPQLQDMGKCCSIHFLLDEYTYSIIYFIRSAFIGVMIHLRKRRRKLIKCTFSLCQTSYKLLGKILSI